MLFRGFSQQGVRTEIRGQGSGVRKAAYIPVPRYWTVTVVVLVAVMEPEVAVMAMV
jgi:hypothetical protein